MASVDNEEGLHRTRVSRQPERAVATFGPVDFYKKKLILRENKDCYCRILRLRETELVLYQTELWDCFEKTFPFILLALTRPHRRLGQNSPPVP